MAKTTFAEPAVKERALRVLLVEDNPADAELVVRELERASWRARTEVVATPEEFARALGAEVYDVVLADYRLKGWTGLDALAELRRQGKDLPFILVTGSLGEERAVECIKAGAADYVLKDRLARLPVAVRRALEEKAQLEGRRRAEDALRVTNEKLQALIEASPAGILVLDPVGGVQLWNPAAERIFGWTAEEALGGLLPFVPPDKQEESRALQARVLRGESFADIELERRRKDGARIQISLSTAPLHNGNGKVVGIVAVVADISERKRAEAERARLMAAIEQAAEAVVITDPEGRIEYVNPAFSWMTGYDREEVLGQPMRLLKSGRHPPEFYRLLWETIRGGKVWQGELVNRRKDGTLYPEEMSITPVLDAGGKITNFIALKQDVTERKKTEEQLRELSGRLLQVQDEERRRLARELHDTVAQGLAAMVLNLSRFQEPEVALEPQMQRALVSSLGIAEQCAREVRTLTYLLHPPLLEELGLVSALRSYAEGFTERSGIRVELEAPPVQERFPAELELALFRVAQESLANVHRHSGAQQARLRLVTEKGELRLEIADAGRGVAPGVLEKFERGGAELGVGLAGMRERLRQLGGRLEVSAEKPGTCVRATLPLPTP